MKDGAEGQQFKRFLPHRAAIAESKAFMRALRAALGLAGTYSLEEIRKPFIIAHVVPNLDAPEIKEAVASNYLQSMGMLFEGAASKNTLPDVSESHPAETESNVQEDVEYGDYTDVPSQKITPSMTPFTAMIVGRKSGKAGLAPEKYGLPKQSAVIASNTSDAAFARGASKVKGGAENANIAHR